LEARHFSGVSVHIAWYTLARMISEDPAAIKRIQDYLTRSNVAMPIHSFQAIKPIDAREMEKEIPGFRVPISYMFLDDKPILLDYIQSREELVGSEIKHDFSNITSDDICIC